MENITCAAVEKLVYHRVGIFESNDIVVLNSSTF